MVRARRLKCGAEIAAPGCTARRSAGQLARPIRWWFAAAAALTFGLAPGALAAPPTPQPPRQGPYFLPRGESAQVVTVSPAGEAEIEFTILTEAVAIKETGPKETVAHFGEVYAFSPTFIVVRAGVPARLVFWNLQPDDHHDFALIGLDPKSRVMMMVDLPPLEKTSYVFTFHRSGLFRFICLAHQPEMEGEIEVLPAAGEASSRASKAGRQR